MAPSLRIALQEDVAALRAVMDAAIMDLQQPFLTAAEIEASRSVMGLDTQLIEDGTYFVAELDGEIAGCGGWSFRATLYGGDHSTSLRDAALLDPANDPAKVRAMYTHPRFARRGVGAAILNACFVATKTAGFRSVELMATLSGEPLYRAYGFLPVEHVRSAPVNGVTVPLIRMRRDLA